MSDVDIKNYLDQQVASGEFSFSDDISLRQRVDSQRSVTSFALENQKGAIRRSQGGKKPRPRQPPTKKIKNSRNLVDNDPHLAEGIGTLVDYLVGEGVFVGPRNIPYTDAQLTSQDIAKLRELVETSRFNVELTNWVRHALIDGTSYLEINWDEKKVFKPRLLPPERMQIQTNKFGDVTGYIMDSEGEKGEVKFEKYDVAHLGFWKHPEDDYFQPITDRVDEQVDILRDMEIDLARFVATKAFPPILWKLGSEESEWNSAEIQGWMDEVAQIEPESMLVGPHDVEAESVAANENSSGSGGGALHLQPTFEHFEKRITTGLGLPSLLLNGSSDGQSGDVAKMPKFDRRIQRLRTTIRDAIENQILRSLYYHPNAKKNEGKIVPKIEFGTHSSEEERLEVDNALKLFNNGFLNREAFAERVGIDPEVEMPSKSELQSEIIPIIQQLAQKGDNIQNSEGGSPTDSGGGAESAGGEVKKRQEPDKPVDDDSRNKRDVGQE
jgi:hypothetical protein